MNRLEEIKARIAAASPGPWRALVGIRRYDPRFTNGVSVPMVLANNEHALGEFAASMADSDRALIVNAREDLEHLVAEVERLREETHRLYGENASLMRAPALHPDPASLERENSRLTKVAWEAQAQVDALLKKVAALEADNKALRVSGTELKALYDERLDRYKDLADGVADQLEKLGFRVFAPGHDVCDND